MGLSMHQLAQMKQALKSKRAKILIGFGLIFVIAISVILSIAFDTFQSNQFQDSFWVMAFLELLLAAIALVVCSRFGSLASLKGNGVIQSLLQKIFRH